MAKFVWVAPALMAGLAAIWGGNQPLAGAASPAQPPARAQVQTRTAPDIPAPPPAPAYTFFHGRWPRSVSIPLALHPDTLVAQRMPDVVPPSRAVTVYLPLYPGAKRVQSVPEIADMGTPLDGDLVDGSLYAESPASEASIRAWYVKEMQTIGYTLSGQAEAARYGQVTSRAYEFTKRGIPGNPTQFPDIELRFLEQPHGGQTVFSLKASFIVVPPRPRDTYLSTDITRVVLDDGQRTQTVTDHAWISHVVAEINQLPVQTPGISSGGPAIAAGSITTITATFYPASGDPIRVVDHIYFGPVTVGTDPTGLAGTEALWSALVGVFQPR
ncbi:MAG: hypothetical protein K6T78_14960 [Alicyclobacillus sp.]|nr:hypothetical protein [Alicyclobacillus sp.]